MQRQTIVLLSLAAVLIGGAVMTWKWLGPTPGAMVVAEKGAQQKAPSAGAQTQDGRVQAAPSTGDRARGSHVASNTHPAAAAPAGEDGGFSLGRSMIDGIRQRVTAKFADLKVRLHLTDQQMQQASQMIEQRLTTAAPLVDKIFDGKDSKEINVALAALYDGAQADLQQLFSAEQWAEYQKAQTEERQTQADHMAAADLDRLKGSLQLTDQQHEAAYAALYQNSLEFLQQTQSGLRPPADLSQFVQQTAQAKVDALRPVLTADQFDKYDAGVKKYVRGVQNFLNAPGNP
jgi:hypothetical protein